MDISKTDRTIQHNCLSLLVENELDREVQRILLYCMNEFSLEFKIEDNKYSSYLTFGKLADENITSKQLYLWSAPIDLIEQYEVYLETKNPSLANEIYMNCSWPRFGLQCQYELDLQSEYITEPTTLTCYTHLACDRQPAAACLDWTDICNGRMDCPNAIDEKDCLQLEINFCKDDEYRCLNGQCIPKSFRRDLSVEFECIDQSDERMIFKDRPIIASDIVTVQQSSYQNVVCQISLLTSSCQSTREEALVNAMFSVKDESVHEKCWLAFKDLIYAPDMPMRPYHQPCSQMNCLEMIDKYCPPILFVPNTPVLFGDIYFAYRKIDAANYYKLGRNYIYYLCPNNPRYYEYFKNHSKISFSNRTCFRPFFPIQYHPSYTWLSSFDKLLTPLLRELNVYNVVMNYTADICNRWHMYQCQYSSKCISIYRIKNSLFDCPYKDDENDTHFMNDIQLVENLKKTHFKCSRLNLYISYVLMDDGYCQCGYDEKYGCDDEKTKEFNPHKSISFQKTCNEFTELIPQLIDGRNETDETECQHWPCNNIYSRCNGLWQCPNGADEIGCLTSSVLNCSSEYHLCISFQTYRFQCLPKEKVFDGNVDCVGATDEPKLCRDINNNIYVHTHKFYCLKNSRQSCLGEWYLCDGTIRCDDGSDERFCATNRSNIDGRFCDDRNEHLLSDHEKFFCQYLTSGSLETIVYFRLGETRDSIKTPLQDKYFLNSSLTRMPNDLHGYCNYGLSLKVWLNDENNSTAMTCLCPPTHYGETCQYQNQRIVLTIQFRALSDSLRTVFAIIISVIDDSQQRIVHSYEQITYVSIRDCRRKFHTYLTYATRPKDLSKNYYLHIDFYEKFSKQYRGSVLLPIEFPFLPVHRLVFIVEIPKTDNNQRSCSNKKCGIHGKCTQYANQPDTSSFCLCDHGWSGQTCHIQHTCTCSSDSICIGTTAQNRSICVCPMNKFGSRCLLTNTICQSNDTSSCNQHGYCLPNDDSMLYNKTFICVCSDGYHGDQCELSEKNLILVFHENIITSQNIFIHFIQVRQNENPLRSTLFRTYVTQQNSISIRWSLPFHLVFVEFQKRYYLAYVQQIFNRSSTSIQKIHSSNYCPNITDIFNQTILQWHPIRQIKYYHLLCQNASLNLSCFHDAKHLCICQEHMNNCVANCFEFDHEMKYDCLGQNECENNAACLHDKPQCPTRSMCICPACYFGSRCQFSTSGFGLSLDAILGYHILPEISMIQQSSIVQFSLTVTIIFLIIGLINGILCIITFKNKVIIEVGCGLYLLTLSIITLVTMTIFAWKFFILLFTQMKIFSNRTFLLSQCYSIDVLLSICLLMDKWLHACVSVERTTTIIKGIRFDKTKSKKSAKYAINIILLIVIGTSIHDSFNRNLLDEQSESNDEIKRIWCIVRYSSFLQSYDSVIQSVHFIGAFAVNIISATVLIWKKTRQEQSIHPNKDFKKILRQQIQKYRHILTSPLILTILTIPRLIIIFISKCMQSSNDSWLFLIGYFISFLPLILTFVIYILPSKYYKIEFKKTIQQYNTQIRRLFYSK